jgi:hypothetical protein
MKATLKFGQLLEKLQVVRKSILCRGKDVVSQYTVDRV